MKKYPIISPTDPFNALQTMDLLIRIETALAGQESIIAIAIKNACREGVAAKEIIKTCKDNIRDNENYMGDLLGLELVKRIKAYEITNRYAGTGIGDINNHENCN